MGSPGEYEAKIHQLDRNLYIKQMSSDDAGTSLGSIWGDKVPNLSLVFLRLNV